MGRTNNTTLGSLSYVVQQVIMKCTDDTIFISSYKKLMMELHDKLIILNYNQFISIYIYWYFL